MKMIYIKDITFTWWIEIACQNAWAWWTSEWQDYNCARWDDIHPMEFHFCSRVEYISTKADSIEICGILTNFFE